MNYTKNVLKADALCLGPHWIYDQSQLADAYPKGIYAPSDPLSPYHPNRKAGQNTHLGDQVRFLSESINEFGGYDSENWKKSWLQKMSNYDGYIDGATKAVLSTGGDEPSSSNEFAVVARIAPILDLGLPVDLAVELARDQAKLTHAGEQIPEVIEYFVRVIYRIGGGQPVKDSLTAESETDRYPKLAPAAALKTAEQADKQDFCSVAKAFGQACSLESALPLTLYFAIHHGDDIEECLSKNALAGGDSTARAMILSMLYT